ncbi:cytochrome P450 [Melanogaster broomeanus]|nr:cytochrome P450 [Melanogaster broomeanus]
MPLPPGLVALVRVLPRLFLAPGTVYLGLQACDSYLGQPVPRWFRISAYVLSLPVAFIANVVYAQITDRRQAALRGVVLPPEMNSKWPGALDKLSGIVWNFSNGYLGDFPTAECQELGDTFNMRVLYENRDLTILSRFSQRNLNISRQFRGGIRFNETIQGPIFWDQFSSLLGTGVFNSDADIWNFCVGPPLANVQTVRFHRSMTRPFFTRDRISDFDIFEKHAEDTINQIKIRLGDGYPVDFQDAVSRFTLDSATEFLFGKDVCSLSAGLIYPPSSPLSKDPKFLNHPANRFARAFSASEIAVVHRSIFGSSWRFFEFWQDKVQQYTKVLSEFIDPILVDSLAKEPVSKGSDVLPIEHGPKEAQEGETLLEHLVKYTKDQTVIKDEALNIMIAGRDTTTATLTFAVYMLSQHSDVLARLREEILTKVGGRRPTHDDLKDMNCFPMDDKIILTSEIYSPFNIRLSAEAQVWPAVNGGRAFYVPPNTMKDLWGPDADVFDPDRFMDDRLHKYLTPNPFIFLPFNAGPRICLGQQFAYNEVSYFLVRLLQSFDAVSLDIATQDIPPADWSKATGRKAVEKVILRAHLTLYVKVVASIVDLSHGQQDGLWVRMSARAVEFDVPVISSA